MTVHLSTLSSTGDRGTPTGSGAYYTSMSTWESAAQNQHLAGDQTILECYRGTGETSGNYVASGLYEGTINITGFSNNTETDNIEIRAADGESHGGVINAGFVLSGTFANTTIIIYRCQEAWVTVRGINMTSANQGPPLILSTVANDSVIDCIITSISESLTEDSMTFPYMTGVFRNNLFALLGGATDTNMMGVDARRSGSTWENNTFIGNSSSNSALMGFTTGTTYNSSHIWKNNNIFCNKMLSTSGTIDGTNWDTNAYKDAISGTTVGANQILGIESTDFNNYISNDYSPAPAGALDGAVNPGLDLSGTFTGDITTELTGLTRTVPWEVGAYALEGAAPTIIEEMYVKDGGTWVKYKPYVKDTGVWVETKAYVKEAGVWVQVYGEP